MDPIVIVEEMTESSVRRRALRRNAGHLAAFLAATMVPLVIVVINSDESARISNSAAFGFLFGIVYVGAITIWASGKPFRFPVRLVREFSDAGFATRDGAAVTTITWEGLRRGKASRSDWLFVGVWGGCVAIEKRSFTAEQAEAFEALLRAKGLDVPMPGRFAVTKRKAA